MARWLGAGHGPTAVAIVIDNSMSSGTVVNGRRLLDQFKAMARQLTAQASAADRLWLVTADGRVRWELDGLPWSDWGVNDAVRAATVGFDDASVLVLGGAIRGVFVMGSADASWLAFQMPDGSVRWEHDGVPVQRQ